MTEPVSGARLGKRSSEFDGASCVLNSFQKYARVRAHARAIKKAKLGPLRSFLYQSACRANAIPFEITMCFAVFYFKYSYLNSRNFIDFIFEVLRDEMVNLGAGRLQTSTLRRRINQRDSGAAAIELRR